MSAAKARGNCCELCHGREVAVYCRADNAFLCSYCDLTVHSANFLAARHLRRPLCRPHIAGPRLLSCHSCSPEKPEPSKSQAPSRRRREPSPMEGVFVNWCRRLEVENPNAVARTALRWMLRLKASWRSVTNDSMFRVGLAASLWLGTRTRGAGATWKDLRRVQCVSGVAGKLILGVETKAVDVMSRKIKRLKRRRRIRLIRIN